jgi:hypothetical protein
LSQLSGSKRLTIRKPASEALAAAAGGFNQADMYIDRYSGFEEPYSPGGGLYDGHGYGHHIGQRSYGSSSDDDGSCDDGLGGSFTFEALRSLMQVTSLTSFVITTACLFDNRPPL